jgi:hypothetical protein
MITPLKKFDALRNLLSFASARRQKKKGPCESGLNSSCGWRVGSNRWCVGRLLSSFPICSLIVLVPILIFPFFFEVPAALFIGFWALSQLFSGTLSLTY